MCCANTTCPREIPIPQVGKALLANGEIVPVVAALDLSRVAPIGLCIGLMLVLIHGFNRWKLTTLRYPLAWAMLATADLACLIWTLSPGNSTLSPLQKSALQFAVAAMTFCPLMSVLGAKRPQEVGWNWVVFTLWIIVVWPAAQAVMLPQGTRLELFLAWKLFVLGLIGLGLLNYLPTKNAIPAILTAYGQYMLLDPYLFEWQLVPISDWVPEMSVLCFFSAAVIAGIRKPYGTLPEDDLASSSQEWLRFRDAYGAFWALRFLGRLIQTAELQGWSFQPTWSGFIAGEKAPIQKQLEELEQAMDGFLRRFV